ncbi:F-box only protein 6 isoform X2 [Cephus cinctus]|nr:F-box only protein 6 isoform X2 [Cephus cinctus]
MGQHLTGKMESRVQFDENDNNGLTITNQYIPEELLSEILCYVPYKTLLNCQLVCKRWKILIQEYVWRKKAEMIIQHSLPPIKNMPWSVYYDICKKRPFERNLLKNHSGKEDINRHWKIWSNGGDHWIVECPPLNVPPLPSDPVFEGGQHCFVTSYRNCTKEQTIDLGNEGLTPYLMDKLQPPIVISEWYSCRWDCPAIYECTVELLGDSHDLIDSFQFHDIIEGDRQNQWHRISHEFKNYGPHVKQISFRHGGKDKSFWAGHYGSKMAGACVIVKIPEMQNSNDEISNTSSILDLPFLKLYESID